MPDEAFVNYYELMQLDRSAEPEAIQRVYRILAARHHPDNKETGDIEKFLLVKEAYKVLADPERRAEYDKSFDEQREGPMPIFLTKEFTEGVEGEMNRRMGVMCLLYNKRKQQPGTPSLSLLDLEATMFIPREHLIFSVWYLKAKKYIVQDDRSSLMITADGIDFIEEKMPTQQTIRKLLGAAEYGGGRQTQSVFTTGWADPKT